MKRRTLLLACLPFLLLLTGARVVPLVDPDPVQIPAGVAPAQVVRAIRLAFTDKGWTVDREEPGLVEATLHIRAHTVRLAAKYDASAVTIAYLDSQNLLYEEKNGQRMIHRNYRNWLANVVNGVRTNLAMAVPG